MNGVLKPSGAEALLSFASHSIPSIHRFSAMHSAPTFARFLFAAAVTFASTARIAHAQICHGAPSTSSVAYDRGSFTTGGSNGVTAALVAGRAAFTVGARAHQMQSGSSALGADGRLSIQMRANRLVICPNLGVGYLRSLWEPTGAAISVTSHNVALRGGAALGLEQHVYRGVYVTPSLGARYAFKVWYLSSDVDGEEVATGDTVSSVEIEYGLTARYRYAYLGWSALRDTDNKGNRPASARFFIGLALGGGRKEPSPKK